MVYLKNNCSIYFSTCWCPYSPDVDQTLVEVLIETGAVFSMRV